MHGDPGRLVDHQQVFILKDHREAGRRHELAGIRCRSRHTHGRNPHHVAQLQPIGGIDPPLVYAHFTRPQDAVDMALGHPFREP